MGWQPGQGSVLPDLVRSIAVARSSGDFAESAGDFAGFQAGGADVETLGSTVDDGADALNVGIPTAICLLLRPRHIMPKARALGTDVAYGCHWYSLIMMGDSPKPT